MDATSSPAVTAGAIQIEVMKKAMNVEAQSVLKLLDGMQQDSLKVAASKINGIGGKLDVTA